MFVVRPRGRPADALEDAAAASAALEITEDKGFVLFGDWLLEFCSPAPNVREYVSKRETSEGTLLPLAKCCAAAGP